MNDANYTLRPGPVAEPAAPSSGVWSVLADARLQAFAYVIVAYLGMYGSGSILDACLASGVVGPNGYRLAMFARPIALIVLSSILLLHLLVDVRASARSQRPAARRRSLRPSTPGSPDQLRCRPRWRHSRHALGA